MASTPSNAALRTEVWTADVRERLIHGTEFLNSVQDFTQYVNESQVTVPIQGTLPTVEINLDLSDPDTNIGREKLVELNSIHNLDTYGTKETIIRNIDTKEITYDILSLHTNSHAQALQEEIAKQGMYALGVGVIRDDKTAGKTNKPDAKEAKDYATVLRTTGSVSGGVKKLKFEDIIKMQARFDQLLIPTADRYMILNARMRADLQEQNLPLYNQLNTEGSLYGFNVMYHELLPTYTVTTAGSIKVSTVGDATGGRKFSGAIFFQKNYTFKALGNIEMFSRVNDSQIRGTGVNFEVRYVVDKVNSTSTDVAKGGHAMGKQFGFGTIVQAD